MAAPKAAAPKPKAAPPPPIRSDEETGDPEREPLLSGRSAASMKRKKGMSIEELGMKKCWSGHYDPATLTTYKTCFSYIWKSVGTVFSDRHIWVVCLSLFTFAGIVASLVIFLLEDPHMLSTDRFSTVVKYLKVFLAFMLGMFMNNSLNRWWQTVNTTTDYFNNVEKLIFLANAFGIPHSRREEIIRYSIASCICLRTEVCQTWEKNGDKIREAWADTFDELVADGFLTEEEVEVLAKIRPGDRAVCVWGWVSAVFCVMFEVEQNMKPMAMNRLTQQCQVAVDMVSQLKTQICIQLPFMYAHMMACMVHLNNLLVATNCGLGLGTAAADIIHGHGKGTHVLPGEGKKLDATLAEDIQSFVVDLVTLFFEPMLYQAFLQIGANFCYPFGTEYHHVPLHAMIKDLEKNLTQMCFVVDSKLHNRTELPSGVVSESDEQKRRRARPDEEEDDDDGE